MRFVDVWKIHDVTVHRGCVKWMRGQDDADEAYGRTAVQALQHWPDEFADLEHAKAWLLTVARNVCRDLHRERNKRREISLDSDVDPLHADRMTFGSRSFSHPEDEYVAREQGRLLRSHIEHLPPLLRPTATLHFLGEMPYGEVARQLGITEVNVRKRIQQAREHLRAAVRTSGSRVSCLSNSTGTRSQGDEPAVLYTITVTRADGLQHDVVLELALPRRSDSHRLERLQTNLRLHPRSRSKRLDLARVLASHGQLREAIPHYHAIVAKQCFRLQPWLELGAILEALGHGAEAAALYERGAAEVGRPGDQLHLQALERFTRGALDEALTAIDQAIARDPNVAHHHRLRAQIALARTDDLLTTKI